MEPSLSSKTMNIIKYVIGECEEMHTYKACRCKQREHAQEGNPQKSTFPYLWVHSVAFKYNVADLNTVCYSVKLQGTVRQTFRGFDSIIQKKRK